MEDLIEEIVGEIEDESDLVKPTVYKRIDKDTIITNGDIEIDEINEIFKTNVPEGVDYASLNGLLHEKLQDIPQAGDKIEVDDLRIVVEKVLKNVPQKIRIEKIKA
jgi:CBS domain containing-hemolysin-like protein